MYKLVHHGSSWVVNPLHEFAGGSDGAHPEARVIIGPDGNLYGTTYSGGTSVNCGEFPGCGTLFELSPPPTICHAVLCPWIETVLYRFQGGLDGASPASGDLLFDSQGNIYGTTEAGGGFNAGTVYELTRSNGTWVHSVLYSFTSTYDGGYPLAGVIMDSAGNLYGTTYIGIGNGGTVYELTPSASGWTEQTLHAMNSPADGEELVAGLIFDSAGNLYGAASGGGPDNGGTVFELTQSGSTWTFQLLHSHSEGNGGGGPEASLTIDRSGSLYGTNYGWIDGNDGGSIFKLTPSSGDWTYTLLQEFDCNDGCAPLGGVTIDPAGNLYGTTFLGGLYAPGTIWELTP